MSLFDANPQTAIPDTAGYPVIHHGHLFAYPEGHPVVDYGSPQAQWERNHPHVSKPIPDYDAADILAFENPLLETVFAIADEQEAEAHRTRPSEPKSPARDPNSRFVGWYALTVLLVLMAFAVGWLAGYVEGGAK